MSLPSHTSKALLSVYAPVIPIVTFQVQCTQYEYKKKNSEVEEEKTELPTGWSQVQLVINPLPLFNF